MTDKLSETEPFSLDWDSREPNEDLYPFPSTAADLSGGSARTDVPPHLWTINMGKHPVQAFDEELQQSYRGTIPHAVPSQSFLVASQGVSAESSLSNKSIQKTKKPKAAKTKSSTAHKVKVRRPLSAYNMFFRDERERLLAILPVRKEGKPRRSHGKLGFVDMAKQIGGKWRNLDEVTKAHYMTLAAKDKERYQREKEQAKKKEQQDYAEKEGQKASCYHAGSTPIQPNLWDFSDIQTPEEVDHVWSIDELARRLGPDGINFVVRSFC